MPRCPKCKSDNVTIQMVNTGMKTKQFSNGFEGQTHNAGKRFLSKMTFGISDAFVRERLGEEETDISSAKTYICQSCGYTSNGHDFEGSIDLVSKENQSNSAFSLNDPTVAKAVEMSIKKGAYSTAFMQTYLGKGHSYVNDLGAWLEEIGAIEHRDDNKPRKMLVTNLAEFSDLIK